MEYSRIDTWKAKRTISQLPGFPTKLESTNLLLVNIGCVILDNNNEQRFISKPVYIEDAQAVDESLVHSEVLFIEHYLKNKKQFGLLIESLL